MTASLALIYHHMTSIKNINETRIKELGELVWKTKNEFENKIIKKNNGIIIVHMASMENINGTRIT
jgi:hypothetical protein